MTKNKLTRDQQLSVESLVKLHCEAIKDGTLNDEQLAQKLEPAIGRALTKNNIYHARKRLGIGPARTPKPKRTPATTTVLDLMSRLTKHVEETRTYLTSIVEEIKANLSSTTVHLKSSLQLVKTELREAKAELQEVKADLQRLTNDDAAWQRHMTETIDSLRQQIRDLQDNDRHQAAKLVQATTIFSELCSDSELAELGIQPSQQLAG